MKREQTKAPLLLFYSYANEDELLREQLEKHLRLLSRQGLISDWHNRKILPGSERSQEIDAYLEAASIVLLLVSADFLASDYCYETEMQRALERHKSGDARVIPIILRPCDWKSAPFSHLECLPRDGKPVTTWDDQDTAFTDIARGIRRAIEYVHLPAHPLPPVQRENRARLIKQMRAIWIEGLLKHSLRQATWLDLGLREQSDAQDNPWDMLVQELHTAPHPIPANASIAQVYDQTDGRLLILGEPGSGKTSLLLQLTRILLERAEHDTYHPIPVVFILSSWAQKRQSLADWLVAELKARYNVPTVVAQSWISQHQILPLLDGLDEVAPTIRIECINAINTYIQGQPDQELFPLAVSCRSQEYTDLSTHIAMNKAVSILPLSAEQIDTYLQSGGKRVEAIRRALQADAVLAEMAHTPLLLNIFVLAYLDTSLENLPLGHSHEEILSIIFEAYVKRMLHRRGSLRSAGKRRALEHLTFLAKQMHRNHQTVFSVETLQADGLSKRQTLVYNVITPLRIGLTFFLVVGLLTALATGLQAWQDPQLNQLGLRYTLDNSLNNGTSMGVIVGFFAMLVSYVNLLWHHEKASKNVFATVPSDQQSWNIRPKEVLTWDWSWKKVRIGLISGFTAGFVISLASVPGAVVIMLAMVVIGLPAIWIARALNDKYQWIKIKIQLLPEGLPWHWSRKDVRFWLLCGLIICLFLRMITNTLSLELWLFFSLPVWLIVSMLTIASGSQKLQRTSLRPNEGIRLSGKNGLLLGLIIACGLSISISFILALSFSLLRSFAILGIPIGLTVGLSLGLFFGLEAFFQHFSLRFWFWLLDYFPWNIVAFLDEMVERILLRKIGGSYIFTHRHLLDYFAALTPTEQVKLAETRDTKVTPHSQKSLRTPLRPQKLLHKKLVVSLIALACLSLSSLLIVICVQDTRNATRASNATNTANAQHLHALQALNVYPSTFPGQGNILLYSIQKNYVLSIPNDPANGCVIQTDGYHISQKQVSRASFCGYEDTISNIAIRVQMDFIRGDCGGITFRGDPKKGSGYFFYVCQNGTYGLSKSGPQTSTVSLIPATPIPGNLQQTNTLSVVALGDTITLFIQGKQLTQIQDDQYTKGAFGFAAFATHRATEVLYHNMQTWSVQP